MVRGKLFLPLYASVHVPGFPFSSFVSGTPLGLFLSRNGTLKFHALFPSTSCSPCIIVYGPFFGLGITLYGIKNVSVIPGP